MVRRQTIFSICAACFAISACVSSPKVDRVKLGDKTLSCSELVTQMNEADDFKTKAEGNKGANKDNVVAGVFFFPALVSTYLDANDAIKAAEDRKMHLMNIYNERKCAGQQTPQPVPQAKSAATTETKPTSSMAPTRESPQADSAPQSVVAGPMSIAEMQRALLSLGYQPGSADGAMGKRTIDALKKFQQANGLSATGALDPDTVVRLRNARRGN